MAYEMVMPYHLHMPSYFLETFTEYPSVKLTLYLYYITLTFIITPTVREESSAFLFRIYAI